MWGKIVDRGERNIKSDKNHGEHEEKRVSVQMKKRRIHHGRKSLPHKFPCHLLRWIKTNIKLGKLSGILSILGIHSICKFGEFV